MWHLWVKPVSAWDQPPPQSQTNWWTAYHDPQLDLVNRDWPIGKSDVRGSTCPCRKRKSATSAQRIEAVASDQWQHPGQSFASRRQATSPPIGGTAATLFQAGLSLGWDLDLFGRQHALVRSAGERADASAFDAAAAKLAVSVSIAQTYVSLARATQQIKVIKGIVATRQQSLALVKSRGRADLAGDLEVQTNETLVAQAEQAITRASRDRDTLIHALAALVGTRSRLLRPGA